MVRISVVKISVLLGIVLIASASVIAQSGHSARNTVDLQGSILSVTATRTDNSTSPIRAENLYLYENAIEQKIKNFSYDPSPARIVILVDNSQTVPTDIATLQAATMEFAYEIYDGDQLFVIGYDEKPEIIQEWTDDAKKLEASLKTYRKQGNPHLFDAINAATSEVLVPLMPGTRKTAIVVIGDGLDRGSKTPFDKMLNVLQQHNITVYALTMKDRTGGAYRRYQPKAGRVIKSVTTDTGGRAFPISEAKNAAKLICDELRKNRYLLSYFPTNTSSYDARRLFIATDEGIEVRLKAAQPPNIK
ncbi:MAG: VWA domain-containing protein [Pyrinomonadaceae bacterium]|nr:VWA domain-containing protein [Pyrinomonadaceae bacterium]